MTGARSVALLAVVSVVAACSGPGGKPPDARPADAGVTLPLTLTIHPGEESVSADGLRMTGGGDADVEVVTAGSPPVSAARTGNGVALPASDGNGTPDSFLQLDVPDAVMFEAAPTAGVVVEIEYLDAGTDGFAVEYDAEDGVFTQTREVVKTDTGRFRTARFTVAGAYFGDRDNGADLRIDDRTNGAETIRTVSITLEPPGRTVDVDSCGADPFDDLPDADAIQTCIDQAQSGDVIRFTSAGGQAGYRGYLIDKTVFLVGAAPARSRLTFTSTDPADRALLQATAGLHGFVVRLFSRSALTPAMQGQVDDITIEHLHVDGDRTDRFCFGPDGGFDGVDDNWGSTRAGECDVLGDAWCLPGSLALGGAFDFADATQDYLGHPDAWSTGLVADDLVISNTTCGTALGLNGAASAIARTTVDSAGDHVHGSGCTKIKPGEPVGDWSDGFTVLGPAQQIVGDTVIDPSDVGVVLFGGRDTAVADNLVQATAGNHGMFAAIAVHAWTYGDVGGGAIVRNTVTSAADTTCGGIHAGINLGPHMWGGACAGANASAVGAAVAPADACPDEPTAPAGAACPATGRCQEWASVPASAPFTLADNQVSGADLNYLIEGLDGAEASLVTTGNVSTTPRATDWGAAATGCGGVTWTPTDFVAHHPARTGWTDLRVHCER